MTQLRKTSPVTMMFALLALSACSSGKSAPGAAGGAAGSGNNVGATQAGSGGAAATAGSGGPGGMQPQAGAGTGGGKDNAGQAGTASPAGTDAGAADDPNTVTVSMETFTVAANSEVFMCQDFDNPFGGQDVALGQTVSDMTAGSHHLHVFYGVGTPRHDHVTTCENPNEFRPLLHISTLPHMVSAYPAGTAAKLKGATGIRLQVHYLNLTDKPIDARVTVKLTKVDPATVQRWVAQIHFNRVAMTIPPGTMTTVSTSCKIPATFGPIGLLSGVSHMHKQGVHFVAKTGSGTQLLDTTNWDDPPPTYYATPVMLNPGDSIDWSCTYDNMTNNTLTYGDSAKTNEMCIYIARFFSSPNGDDLECETPFPSATATVNTN